MWSQYNASPDLVALKLGRFHWQTQIGAIKTADEDKECVFLGCMLQPCWNQPEKQVGSGRDLMSCLMRKTLGSKKSFYGTL
jgi:hypothetical protein